MARQSPRVTVQFEARMSGAATGHGVVYNLSLDGCQIESPLSILVGMKLTVVMDIDREPLAIDLAAVRWANPPYFGVEFLVLRPQEQARLDGYLSSLFRPPTVAADPQVAHPTALETGVDGRDAPADSKSAALAEGVSIDRTSVRDERQFLLPFL